MTVKEVAELNPAGLVLGTLLEVLLRMFEAGNGAEFVPREGVRKGRLEMI